MFKFIIFLSILIYIMAEKTGYVLQLENNKYYVGTTNNLNQRLNDHFTGNGAEWTKQNKPVKVVKTFNANNYDSEKDTTLRYMSRSGVDNVRGSGYSQRYMSNSYKNSVKEEIDYRGYNNWKYNNYNRGYNNYNRRYNNGYNSYSCGYRRSYY